MMRRVIKRFVALAYKASVHKATLPTVDDIKPVTHNPFAQCKLCSYSRSDGSPCVGCPNFRYFDE
jgi:hypothetical protein